MILRNIKNHPGGLKIYSNGKGPDKTFETENSRSTHIICNSGVD